jgi:hypothetical protein
MFRYVGVYIGKKKLQNENYNYRTLCESEYWKQIIKNTEWEL